MRGGDAASLTQRRGYPKPSQSTFLDLPTGEEDDRAAAYTSPPGKKHDQTPIRKGGRQEPWIVQKIEAFSKASVYTKATYGWVLVSLAVAWMGFRGIRHGHASVWLTCGATSCDLEITPPGPPKVTRVTILREQLIRSAAVKAGPDGNVVRVLEGTAAGGTFPHKYGAKKKKKGKNPRYDVSDKGPDEDGNYDSYVIVASEFGPDTSNDDDDAGSTGVQDASEQKKSSRTGRHPTNSLESLSSIGVVPNEAGEYVIQMRRFNLGQSRRKAMTTVTRVNSYIRNRRHKLQIRETKHVAWQSIVAIVFGIFSLILSLLCGQFWEPEPIHHRVAGPGTRIGGGRPPPRRAPPANPGLHGIRQDRRGNTTTTNGYGGSYGGYSPQKRSY